MKQRVRKVFSLLCVIMFTLVSGVPAVAVRAEAQGDIIPEIALFGSTAEASTIGALSPVAMYGTIIGETDGMIEVQNHLNEEDTVLLHVSDDVFVVDAVTGQPATLQDRETDRVAVFYGPAATMSLPPQSKAVAIAVNLPEGNFSPHYAVVESVTVEPVAVESDDSIKILTGGGSLYVTINREAPIMPYLTRNIVTIDHIREGSKLMLWYDMVAQSYPAQAVSLQTVLLHNPSAVSENNTLVVTTATGTALLNGTEINVGESVLFPLRIVSDVLGYTVGWNADTASIRLTLDMTEITLSPESCEYRINGETFVLEHAPVIVNGITQVPVEFLEKALNVTVRVSDITPAAVN